MRGFSDDPYEQTCYIQNFISKREREEKQREKKISEKEKKMRENGREILSERRGREEE